ncbi:hypothetical protein CDAR_516331 [Caerostris darwini]|uniref:Uncharacterized protein n=1 Tax=Caerostris darwini TaxID=1538125 RepID=A0AAV4WYT1_9ARAC|nr:hypothetical protein CDAR_516331 [Caerostris darwini]
MVWGYFPGQLIQDNGNWSLQTDINICGADLYYLGTECEGSPYWEYIFDVDKNPPAFISAIISDCKAENSSKSLRETICAMPRTQVQTAQNTRMDYPASRNNRVKRKFSLTPSDYLWLQRTKGGWGRGWNLLSNRKRSSFPTSNTALQSGFWLNP